MAYSELDVFHRMIARTDTFTKQNMQPDHKGKYTYFRLERELTDKRQLQSLSSESLTIAIYLHDPITQQCKIAAIDIDGHTEEEKKIVIETIRTIYKRLTDAGLHPFIEASAGLIEDGGHIKMFMDDVKASDIIQHLRGILGEEYEDIEIFPKQPVIRDGEYGNAIKLPWQFNNRTGQRSQIVDPETLEPMERADAIEYLMAIPCSDIPEYPEQIEEVKAEIIKETDSIESDKFFVPEKWTDRQAQCLIRAYNDNWQLTDDNGHKLRAYFATEMAYNGATDADVHEFFKRQKDYDANTTQKYLDYTRRKVEAGLKPVTCKTIKSKLGGFVPDVRSFCKLCSINRRRVRYEKKEQEKQRISNLPDAERFLIDGPRIYFNGKSINAKKVGHLIMGKYYFLTIEDTKEVYYYADGVYVPGGENLIATETQALLGELTAKRHIAEIINYISLETLIKRSEINQSKNLINLKNGCYDVETSEFVDHSPEMLSTVQTPIMFSPSARCDGIGKFLHEVVSPVDIPVLLQFAGNCLVPDNSHQKAVMVEGDGANGKSVFLELLARFVGKENKAAESLQKLNEDKYSVANLYGKSVNIFPDLASAAIYDDMTFKMLTGGDDLRGEKKFKDSFYFENTAKLIFSANKIPPIANDNYAFFRRWIIVSFPNKFEESEAKLKLVDELSTDEELSGFLNVCLSALHWLRGTGKYAYDRTVEEVTNLYILKSNHVKAFVDEMVSFVEEGICYKDKMYGGYKSWCEDNNIKELGFNQFSKQIKKLGFSTGRDSKENSDGKRLTYYDSIELNDVSRKPPVTGRIFCRDEIREYTDGVNCPAVTADKAVCPIGTCGAHFLDGSTGNEYNLFPYIPHEYCIYLLNRGFCHGSRDEYNINDSNVSEKSVTAKNKRIDRAVTEDLHNKQSNELDTKPDTVKTIGYLDEVKPNNLKSTVKHSQSEIAKILNSIRKLSYNGSKPQYDNLEAVKQMFVSDLAIQAEISKDDALRYVNEGYRAWGWV